MSAREKNFSWLLLALVVFLTGIPLIEQSALFPPRSFRAFIVSWLLVVGVWSLRGFGKLYLAALLFAATGVVVSMLNADSNEMLFQYASWSALLGFLFVAIWCTAIEVVRGVAINRNRLVGAVCLYMLMGVAWAVAYTMVELVTPGSFAGVSTHPGQGWDSNWLYFSFITMSTLGYGDVTPTSPMARMLAYMQAMFGLFYIAVLVSGLVGAYVTARHSSSTVKEDETE